MREREVKYLDRELQIVTTLAATTPSPTAKRIYTMALTLMRQELDAQAKPEPHRAPKPYDSAGLLENSIATEEDNHAD